MKLKPHTPQKHACPCGEQTSRSLELVIELAGLPEITIKIPMCAKHASAKVKSARLAAPPTHEDIIGRRTRTMPELGGEVMVTPGMISVCCPGCRGLSSLDMSVFRWTDADGLKPSFVCPQCGVHLWIRSAAWAAKEDA